MPCSDNNDKDGTEFSFIGPQEVGCNFDRVANLAASEDKGVWAILASREGGCVLARFDGQRWETHALDGVARCVVELKSGAALVGTGGTDADRCQGLRKVTWAAKEIEPIVGPENVILEITKRKDGRAFAASWWSPYESDSVETP